MSLSASVHGPLAEIGRETWDRFAGPTGDPFLSYDFLEACEASGCVRPRQGWAPRHLTLEENGAVVGLMPLYLKGHSQGEYVFDIPKVVNGCSDLMVEVFGDAGRHARSAVGVYRLPMNFAVEVDAVVEVR